MPSSEKGGRSHLGARSRVLRGGGAWRGMEGHAAEGLGVKWTFSGLSCIGRAGWSLGAAPARFPE